jgi:hypothetical protein
MIAVQVTRQAIAEVQVTAQTQAAEAQAEIPAGNKDIDILNEKAIYNVDCFSIDLISGFCCCLSTSMLFIWCTLIFIVPVVKIG